MKEEKQRKNERKYKNWEDLPTGGRRYRMEVVGRFGWISRYIKIVNASENTVQFYQEIYNERGKIVEIHKKYPKDKGHQKVLEE